MQVSLNNTLALLIENFLVNFYATNPDCALRPDYETIMENNTNKRVAPVCNRKGQNIV